MIRPDVPADDRCPHSPTCRHIWLDDMGLLDGDYPCCHTCGQLWPCAHVQDAREHT